MKFVKKIYSQEQGFTKELSALVFNAREVQLKNPQTESETPLLVVSETPFTGAIRLKKAALDEVQDELIHPFKNYLPQDWLFVSFFANEEEFNQHSILNELEQVAQVIPLNTLQTQARLVKRMVMHRIWKQFDDANRMYLKEFPQSPPPYILSPNFVSDLEVYVRLDDTSEMAQLYKEAYSIVKKRNNGVQTWRAFSIRFNQNRFDVPFSISIAHKGLKHSLIKPIPLTEALLSSYSRFSVIGRVFSKKNLSQLPELGSQLIPLISLHELKKSHLFEAKSSKRNTLKEDKQYCDMFIKRYYTPLKRADAHAPFKLSKPIVVQSQHIQSFSPKIGELVFGNHNKDLNAKKALRLNGPFEASKHPIHLLLIYAESDESHVQAFLQKSIQPFVSASGITIKRHYPIPYKDESQVHSLLISKFSLLSPEQSSQTFAFILHPYLKTELDEQKRKLYYEIGASLLNYGIASQTIGVQRYLDKNYPHYIPNFSASSTAKLGGVPWKLAHPLADDLVIGISLFKSTRDARLFYGFALGFTGDGRVQHIDRFEDQETRELAGAIRLAIKGYFSDSLIKTSFKPKRLVLHVYKQLSNRELKHLNQVLNELDVAIPVYIVTIYQQYYNDVFIVNELREDKVVPNATAIQMDQHHYLLQANELYKEDMPTPNSFPKQLKIGIRAGSEKYPLTDKIKQELLEQVYQFSKLNFRSVATQPFPITVLYPKWMAEKLAYMPNVTIHPNLKNRLWFL